MLELSILLLRLLPLMLHTIMLIQRSCHDLALPHAIEHYSTMDISFPNIHRGFFWFSETEIHSMSVNIEFLIWGLSLHSVVKKIFYISTFPDLVYSLLISIDIWTMYGLKIKLWMQSSLQLWGCIVLTMQLGLIAIIITFIGYLTPLNSLNNCSDLTNVS